MKPPSDKVAAPRRAVLYMRVSRGETQTIDSQREALRPWCKQRGWSVVAEEHDAISGDIKRRRGHPPGLASALERVRQRKADVLVVYAADRLVRHPTALLALCALVRSYDGHIASYMDGADLDTTSEVGELIVFIRGWFARMELRLNQARTKAGLQAARARGTKLGRPRAELPAVQLVAELRAAGLSIRAMAQRLEVPKGRIEQALAELEKGPAAGADVQQTGVATGRRIPSS